MKSICTRNQMIKLAIEILPALIIIGSIAVIVSQNKELVPRFEVAFNLTMSPYAPE